MELRRREADAFYATVIPASLDADSALVMRQALAGMLWTKQVYTYDVHRWLGERGTDPFSPSGPDGRNRHWQHMRQRGRHLDAGQVGVPVVRCVGPRVPRASR